MGNNPAQFNSSLNNPVEQVSWDDTQEFIQTFNRLVSGLEAQLPSEAQWEYACRAGTHSPFSFGEMITPEQVNYAGIAPYNKGKNGKYRKQTTPVKSLSANRWGLYEMHGNVWEWCQDVFGDLGVESCTDPLNESGAGRVFRGGSWGNSGRDVRSACRFLGSPDDRRFSFGFRLSLIS